MCGFVGIVGVDHVAPAIALGLQSIQHRGQDAAGIATFEGGWFHLHKDLGMVTQALPPHVVAEELPGASGIGHVRYPTQGSSERGDAQPFMTRRPGIILAHNGNVTNMDELHTSLLERGWHVYSKCDSEPILLVLADALNKLRPSGHTEDEVASAVRAVMEQVKGSYSVVAVLEVDGEETLLAFRDPHAIRPAVFGQRPDGAWICASESVALDVLGFARKGFVEAGEMVLFRKGKEPVRRAVLPRQVRHCVFERIYFARPDSMMEDGRVNSLRGRLGRQLAREWASKGFEADVVVAIPDTSRPAAFAIAETLGIPHREGFIKNRYSGRTFIMPDQTTRDAALRLKLNPIREIFEGKRVLLIDDSVVRGSTMRRIAAMVKDLNPAAIHLLIFSPPVKHPCYYGIDMPSEAELIAAGKSREEVEAELAEAFHVDSVSYLSLEGLREVAGMNMCSACFDGDYVVPITDSERSYILKDRRSC
ncbi:MAG: amidophosphoribosyltransferase [Deltaproteobacteria bacterium]|nr:MAG: amidophosphoribosyltransferase [Deltaproteobacteria bacterium]